MRAYIIVGICVSSLGSSLDAHAAGLGSRARAAQRACLTGDPAKGVEMLTDLYLDTEDPTYVYNQGRCYEMNRRYEDAIGRFREYLVKAKKITKAEKADTEQRIAECKRLLDEEIAKKAPPPALPEKPTGIDVVPPPPPPPPTPLPPLPPPPPPQAGHPGSTLRITGLVVGGVGVATLGAAIGLNLKANSLADDANRTRDPGTKSSQKSYKTGAIVCYGVGGAALLTGVTLYLVGRSKGSTGMHGLALVPVWGPDQSGLALGGRF